MLVFVKKFSARSASTAWLLSGVYTAGKWVVYWGWIKSGSTEYFAVMGGATAFALLPAEVQNRKFEELVGLLKDDRSCKKCRGCCSCDNVIAALDTAVAKAFFSSISLSMVLPRVINLPTAITTIAFTGTTYVAAQTVIFASEKNTTHTQAESARKRALRYAVMTGAALGGVMSAGMPIFGLVTMVYMIDQRTLTPTILHENSDVIVTDAKFMAVAAPAILRHAILYATTASQKLRPRDQANHHANSKTWDFLIGIDRHVVIPYAAAVTILGTMVAPVTFINWPLNALFNDVLGLGPIPSMVVSIALVALFAFPENLLVRYCYLLHAPSKEEKKPDDFDMLKMSDYIDDTQDIRASRYDADGYQSKAATPFWKKIFCCCGPKNPEKVALLNDELVDDEPKSWCTIS